MKTQHQRIVAYLRKKGAKLTTLTAAMKGMGVKVQTRIGELERDHGFIFNRKKVFSKDRHSSWFEYTLKKDNKKFSV